MSLYMVFRGYHALRLAHWQMVEDCIANDDYTRCLEVFAIVCKEVFLNEA